MVDVDANAAVKSLDGGLELVLELGIGALASGRWCRGARSARRGSASG